MTGATATGVKGDKKVLRELRRLAKSFPEAVAAAFYEEGLEIFKGSQVEVPVDTGKLSGSARLTLDRKKGSITVYVSYSTDYALKIHEGHHWNDIRKARGEDEPGAIKGKSNYLKDPFEKQLANIETRVAARARVIMRNKKNPLSGLVTVKGSKKGRGSTEP